MLKENVLIDCGIYKEIHVLVIF